MAKKLRIFTAILAACLVLGLVSAQPAMAERYRWKVATLAPKQVGWAITWMNLIDPWVAKATDGQIIIKVYWGGVMGNDDDYIRKMHIGQLHGAGVTGVGANLACPEFSVVGLPFLFEDYDEVDYIRKVMFPTFEYYFGRNGYKLIMWIDQDFDQFYSTKYKFDNLQDFKNARIVTWYGPQEKAMLQALGASPIPMEVTEIPTAKRTGAIDTNIAPSIWQVGSQLYTVDKFVNTMKIRYSPAVIIISNQAFDSVPAKITSPIYDGREEVQTKFVVETRKDNQRCLKAMLDYGVQEVKVPVDQMAEIRKRAMTVYKDLSGELYPPELLAELRQHLDAFRSGNATGTVAAAPAGPAPAPSPGKEAIMAIAIPDQPKAPEPVLEKKAPEAAVEAMADTPAAGKETAPEGKARLEEVAAAYAEAKKAREEAAKEEAAEPPQEAVAAAPAPDPKSTWAERKRQISEVQRVLKSMGLYDSELDGIYGPVTRKGLMAWQTKNRLAPTGIIDQALLDRMGIK